MKWEYIESMNVKRMYHSSHIVEDKIYSIGGIDDNEKVLNDIEYYDLQDKQWH